MPNLSAFFVLAPHFLRCSQRKENAGLFGWLEADIFGFGSSALDLKQDWDHRTMLNSYSFILREYLSGSW